MILAALVMLVVCIAIPLVYTWRIARMKEPHLAGWLIAAAEASVIVGLVVILGRWDMAGYYIRTLLLVVFTGAVVVSFLRHARRPWRQPEFPVLRGRWSRLASLAVFGGALAYVASGLGTSETARDLGFPLEGGRFMVGQGGGNSLLNRHAGHPAQRYAADIVAIGPAGFRARGLAPQDLDAYEIFGMTVTSPCDGRVTAARDDLPDLVPPARDRAHPRGNHVIIDCDDISVELAHFRHGGVIVENGAGVLAGETLGEVGNSGNTTEPHLHIHAVDPESGAGVPITFAGRAPVRNAVFRR